ncbi:ATP-binding protein [Streptomyces sp. NRRL B-24484]|uniref:ATP-binding protein n=1 Tax=Streptomyces sp. NRRL B-24484 TaxID=1463833 RepID=UPI001331B337|nr:ATP-binding protein [Streptomyces sp. NRRL B-24484]
MTSIPETAAVVLGATTAAGAVATALLARSRRALVARSAVQSEALKASQKREQALQEQLQQFGDELQHLVANRLPGLALHLVSPHHPVPGLKHEALAGTAYASLYEAVLGHYSDTVAKERRRIDASARAALRGACQDIQALSYRLQTQVEGLQSDFDDPRLLDSLFKVDHLNEQAIRLVQKAAIVCGAWPGHVRPDTYVVEIVSGASSRLHGYERIKISSRLLDSNLAVVGRAAEPIAVALTELMANALEHSRDDLAVEAGLIQTGNGSVCIIIDDAGTGMSAEAVRRGVRLLSVVEQQDTLLTELGDPPALGLAAIGRLVADHGFQVSIDQVSPYNGVRAVLTIPPHLLTTIDEEKEPISAMAPLPAAPPPAPQWPTPAASNSTRDDGSDLPQRHRRARTEPARSDAPDVAPRELNPETARDTWSQFQAGLAAGQAPNDSKEDQ